MSEKVNETTDEEEVEEEAKETNVDDSRFDKYRESYLREQLKDLPLNGSEKDTALSFVKERLKDDDSNIAEVIAELKTNMRLQEREKVVYYDPSYGNTRNSKPPKADGTKVGRELYDRVVANDSRIVWKK